MRKSVILSDTEVVFSFVMDNRGVPTNEYDIDISDDLFLARKKT